MPTKGTKLKAPRQKGVNKTQLKKDGFAHDPPIPYDQFGGDKEALRQFKAFYQEGGKGRKDKQLKGLMKDMKSGRLYLPNEEKSRYVELTEEQYDNIVKEIGERVALEGQEPRIGTPYQGRTKDQEVIEPAPAPAQVPTKKPKESKDVSDALIESLDREEEYTRLNKIKPKPDYLQRITDEAQKLRNADSDLEDEVGENGLAVRLFNEDYIMDNQFNIYNYDAAGAGVATVGRFDFSGKSEIVLFFKGFQFGYGAEDIPVSPEPEEPEEPDTDTEYLDYSEQIEQYYDNDDLKRGNFLITNQKGFDGTRESIKIMTARFIPSLDTREDEGLFPDYFTYRWRDVWWVCNQHIRDGDKVINPDADDEFSYEDEDGEEVIIVGFRAMRGRRRVLLVKPPRFRWEDDDNSKTIYIYEAGKKYYEGNAELIGKENYGDDSNEITAAELTPVEQPTGLEDPESIQYGYIERGFEWYAEENGGDGDEDGAYSEDDFDDVPTGVELKNPTEENDIDMKDANYIVALESLPPNEIKQLSKLRVEGGAGGGDREEENEYWINKFKEFTTEGREREAIFSELVEEILSGEVDEILKAKILEEMGVIDSKKKSKMGSGKGKKPKFRKIKKELTQAQQDALMAARFKRAEMKKQRLAKEAAESKK
tara:strand:- start:608 stop:2563 length:1956 start_codon:yes stop_codon:yes gene_type:complete